MRAIPASAYSTASFLSACTLAICLLVALTKVHSQPALYAGAKCETHFILDPSLPGGWTIACLEVADCAASCAAQQAPFGTPELTGWVCACGGVVSECCNVIVYTRPDAPPFGRTTGTCSTEPCDEGGTCELMTDSGGGVTEIWAECAE